MLPVLGADHSTHAAGFARRYFDALFSGLGSPLVVVFDDCHLLSREHRWFELVREACLAAPPGVSLVFSSRDAPPPVFARLLASSRMTVLGGQQLRFHPEEARQLIEQRAERLGLQFSSNDVERLSSVCGGWGAGIVLVLESTRARGVTGLPELPAGSQELFDYFVTEVYLEFEPELRRSLLESSLLPTMTERLLERLFESRALAQRLLESRHRLFVDEYGSAPTSYRYHPLFREFLLKRLTMECPADGLRTLRRCAAQALALEGELEGAMELSLMNEDGDAAASLLLDAAPRLLEQGRLSTLADWIQRIPERALRQRAELCYFGGVACMASDLERAVDLTSHAFASARMHGDDDGFWRTWTALVSAQVFRGKDCAGLARLIGEGDRARHERALSSPQSRAKFTRVRALALTACAPEVSSTRDAVEAALAEPLGKDVEEIALGFGYYGFRGELSRLAEIIDAWGRSESKPDISPVGHLSLTFARVVQTLFTGQVKACQSLVGKGLEIAERTGVFTLNGALLHYAALAHALSGEVSSLALVVDELGDTARQGEGLELARYQLGAGLEALLREDLCLASRLLEGALETAEKINAPVARCVHGLPCAEVLLRQGQLDAAEERLQGLRSLCESLGFILSQSWRLLAAELAFLRGDPDTGDEWLASALALGARSQAVPMPSPTRPLLAKLVGRAMERSIEPEHTRSLSDRLGLISLSESRAKPTSVRAPLVKVPHHFVKTVRQALRYLHETHRLSESVLLDDVLVLERAGRTAATQRKLETLRQLLHESVEALAGNARTESAHRALYYTYLEPAPTQLLAAAAARMPFGSYRRHLTAGLEEVSSALWLRQRP